MTNQEIASELNDLLTRNYDAEAGYKDAAENANSVGLKNFFKDQASNRYDFGHKIKEEIRALGEEPNKGTSIEGDVHRAWLNFRDYLTSGDSALYKEAIRGEEAALEEYREYVSKTHVPETTKALMRDQMKSIESALNSLKQMEEFSR